MRRVIICDQARFDQLNANVLAWLQSNVDNFSGDNWSDELSNGTDLAFTVTTLIEPALSADDLSDVVDLPDGFIIDEL